MTDLNIFVKNEGKLINGVLNKENVKFEEYLMVAFKSIFNCLKEIASEIEKLKSK